MQAWRREGNFRYSSRGIEEHRVSIRRILALLLLAAAAAVIATRPAGAEMLSAGDQAIYRMAFKAVDKGKWDEAHQLAGMAKNPIPAKVIEWLDLIRPGVGRSFEEISAFIQANPHESASSPRASAIKGNNLVCFSLVVAVLHLFVPTSMKP